MGANEELHLGMCYKMCYNLTNGSYPYRKAANSCCKYPDTLQCLMTPNATVTSPAYNAGGGGDDGLNSPPGSLHPPRQRWAEESTTTTPLPAVIGMTMASTPSARRLHSQTDL